MMAVAEIMGETKRSVRASFLLRCSILVGTAIPVLAVAVVLGYAGVSTGSVVLTGAAVVLVAAFWFLEIELGVLTGWIGRRICRRAGRSEGPVESIWFVDLDAERDRRLEQFHEETRDNPTLR